MKNNNIKNINIEIIIIVLICIIIFILSQNMLYSSNVSNNVSNNTSRNKEKFIIIENDLIHDTNILQDNVLGSTNVFSPYIYYDFKKEENKNKFNLDNYI